MRQGQILNAALEQRICKLLRETDCSGRVIAARCGVSGSTVIQINKRHRIRIYETHSRWTIAGDARA